MPRIRSIKSNTADPQPSAFLCSLTEEQNVFLQAAERGSHYLGAIRTRRVCPSEDGLASLADLPREFQEDPIPAADVIATLDSIGSAATVANAGGRYFGFVCGGAVPAARAASVKTLATQGWDVEEGGIFGAPPISVYVSNGVHVSVLKALSLLGLGKRRIIALPTDTQGRIVTTNLPRLPRHSIVCIQAGDVNTGAFDEASSL
jgi:hypothetical protein